MELNKGGQKAVIAFAGPVVLVYLGQILISNSDIIMVKRFFEPEIAGQYAAVALIGRIVFFATWSVVTALFPIVARKQQKGESHRQHVGPRPGYRLSYFNWHHCFHGDCA